MMSYHVPVLLSESVEGLKIRKEGTYVDLTFGGGGHSKEILKHLTKGRLIAFDQDSDALKNAEGLTKLTVYQSNFRFFHNFLKLEKLEYVDGIIADLGISAYHFENSERGFSFRFDSVLDMRMNQLAEISAVEVLNDYDEENLNRIFKEFGELQNFRNVTRSVLNYRRSKRIEKVKDLLEAIDKNIPISLENKYLAKLFQAIRIEVNSEIEVLKEMLEKATEALSPGGRLVIISYHSLEDRLVKNYFRTGNFTGTINQDLYGNIIAPLIPVNRKAIVPSADELKINNRSRSAKLRIAEKL
jgi:16S rRNA (cytosine1402-N4)-methyltransferase